MKILDKLNYEIRDLIPSDRNRIFSDWLNSYFKTSQLFKPFSIMDNNTYFEEQKKLIDSLLKSKVLVISDRKDSYIVTGFCCFTPTPSKIVLHYIYIVNEFRRLGLGKELIETMRSSYLNEKSNIEASHYVINRDSNKFLNKFGIKYNPYTIINTNA